jgi:hypothetical protein
MGKRDGGGCLSIKTAEIRTQASQSPGAALFFRCVLCLQWLLAFDVGSCAVHLGHWFGGKSACKM